jgi:uncharacterized protein YjdB
MPSQATDPTSGVLDPQAAGSVLPNGTTVTFGDTPVPSATPVTPVPISITASPASSIIGKGKTVALSASVKWSDGKTTTAVSWRSSDEGIVKVDAAGKATAIDFGLAQITAYHPDNPNASDIVEIHVGRQEKLPDGRILITYN